MLNQTIGWANVEDENGNIHTVPMLVDENGELELMTPHEIDSECPCHPEVELYSVIHFIHNMIH